MEEDNYEDLVINIALAFVIVVFLGVLLFSAKG